MDCWSVVREDALCRVEFCRPPLNILDIASLRELEEVLGGLAGESDLRLLALHSNQKAFSAGADVAEHLPEMAPEMLRCFHRALLALANFPTPTVALIEGAALGGGAELALCCDMRLMNEQASLGQPEIKVGVFPPLACLLLPRMLPPAIAWELILTGRSVKAEECLRLGLANAVYPRESFSQQANAFLGQLLCQSGPVLRLTKKALRLGEGWQQSLQAVEQVYLEDLMSEPDALEGLRAFLDKRKPVWV
ncbi:enoyl-CoA hydratase/isomerase family protein [bacterium]|nr:enoyl-CoA hydratase/isomerase family protein [bacterium]